MNPLESIARVTRRLRRLEVPHAFLGGAIVSLLVDDSELHQSRPTLDVDAIVQVITQAEYAELEQRLRDDGFVNDVSEGAPICRYLVEDCKVDVMPISAAAIGLRSRWFPEALSSAVQKPVGANESAPITFSQPFSWPPNWKLLGIEAMKITKTLSPPASIPATASCIVVVLPVPAGPVTTDKGRRKRR